jgi:Mrp family chromosome partitioning ATPase
MSRNFELLQNMNVGKPLDVFEPEDDSQQPHVPVVETATIPLQVAGAERDEIAKLVSRVFLTGNETPRQVVWMGADAGTGCSKICARAAEVLAAQPSGGSVCLVDANLSSPSLHRHFGTDNQVGLTDALRQGGSIRKYAHFLAGERLALITSGASGEGWQMLLGSPQMHTRMSELHREFDYVLVDLPPMNICPETVTLAKASDGLILVVKANATRREVAQKVVHELKSANVRLLGAVLNERQFPIPEVLYHRL